MKYDHDNPVQPRYDINAPDMYIPAMSYITYVVLAGIALGKRRDGPQDGSSVVLITLVSFCFAGMQNRFSSEQLGIQASSALAYSIFEIVIYTLTLYIGNISTSLSTLDLLALSGYKYAAIVVTVAGTILLKRTGYYLALSYSSAMLALFLVSRRAGAVAFSQLECNSTQKKNPVPLLQIPLIPAADDEGKGTVRAGSNAKRGRVRSVRAAAAAPAAHRPQPRTQA